MVCSLHVDSVQINWQFVIVITTKKQPVITLTGDTYKIVKPQKLILLVMLKKSDFVQAKMV